MTEEARNTQHETREQARQRADHAEQELRELKQQREPEIARTGRNALKGQPERQPGGVEALRNDSMMAHLMESLEAGKDIGHYGRLVFTMVASHFLPDETILEWLTKDRDVDREKAAALLRQVEARDYNPPRRERILQWQQQQDFPILPNPHDPDCGNVYKSLKFPDEVYDHIQHYQSEKIGAEQSTN